MLRFKALNDLESSNSETEEDAGRNKPTKEVMEEDATEMYNTALKLLCESKTDQASVLLEEILDSAYLNDEDEPSPLQFQMKLGCLKNLSMIYASSDDLIDLTSAKRVLVDAVELDPCNVSLWTRLGKISRKLGDYAEAYVAFQQGLKCSPHHWICLENLVTLAYALGDYVSCLHYCAEGLERDVGFIRGHVFRDEILASIPHIKSVCQSFFESNDSLSIKIDYDSAWKQKFMSEAQKLVENRCNVVTETRLSEMKSAESTAVIIGRLDILTLAELCRIVFDLRNRLLSSEDTSPLRHVEIVLPVNVEPVTVDEDSLTSSVKQIETDDSGQCPVIRSRSQSDEKDSSSKDEGGTTSGTNGKEPTDSSKLGEDECSQSQLSQDNSEAETKKKRQVKWWQYEGKRRSQRVRGHVQLISQSSVKSERGFAETLKDLIPASLLCNEAGKVEEEIIPKSGCKENEKYFGYPVEAEDVKRFVAIHGRLRIIDIVTELPLFLNRLTCHSNWPVDLVTLYIEACELYRLYRKEHQDWFTAESVVSESLKSDAIMCITRLEFLLDQCPIENLSILKTDSVFTCDKSYLEIAFSSDLKQEVQLFARYCWWLARYELASALGSDRDFRVAMYYLKNLEALLTCNSKLCVKIGTRTDNILNLEEVRKKIRFIGKMKNISRITELYENKDYDALIDTLQLCLTSEDFGPTDLNNRFFLADAYYQRGRKSECIDQCIKMINPCLRSKNEEILVKCLKLLEQVHGKDSEFPNCGMKEKRMVTNAMIHILTSNENKGSVDGYIQIAPWCVLHSILFDLETREPALYLDEETTPNSVVLLQFAHEFLNRSNKCTMEDGKLLRYTVDTLFSVRESSEHGSFEETKHCIEQAIFCLWSHPNKRSKIKYLVEHTSPAINLEWSQCLQLYQYYKPAAIYEFDSYDMITPEVEVLFQRILGVMPEDLKPTQKNFEDMTALLEGKSMSAEIEAANNFPSEFVDIYYLLGDHYFKTKDWTKAIEYYTYDLTVIPARFDSWAAVALAKGDMIGRKLNTCESYHEEDVLCHANAVVNCFERALAIDPHNGKVSIEFGSFVYAMHSFCSRALKQDTEQPSAEKQLSVKDRKGDFLKAAAKSFVAFPKPSEILGSSQDDFESQLDEMWIHHYMLGKVYEKVDPHEPEKYLVQYELAGKRMHEQGAVYPGKINYYSPPELAVEALEIYYRIHASILSYVQNHDYSPEKEKSLISFLDNAATSPFVVMKQVRGGGDAQERRKKESEDSKKVRNEVKDVINDLLTKVEELVAKEISESSSSSSSDDENDNSSITTSRASTMQSSDDDSASTAAKETAANAPIMSSFGLAAFQEKMREKEMKELKTQQSLEACTPIDTIQPSVKIPDDAGVAPVKSEKPPTVTVCEPQRLVDEDNKFYKDFKTVKYANIISRCLSALEECITRFPQHHKSYFRLANTYFKTGPRPSCYKVCKDYLLGNPTTEKKKMNGLFGDRKPGNFFNNVWRNPVDDIDRPGSFPYHMSKTVKQLLDVLDTLNDHQVLAEVGIALSKKPEPEKQYLLNSERQQFSNQALKLCASAARRYLAKTKDIQEAAISIFETYQKLQKLMVRDNVLQSVLLECYKNYVISFGYVPDPETLTAQQAFSFFQRMNWQSKTIPGAVKAPKADAPGKETTRKPRATNSKRIAEREATQSVLQQNVAPSMPSLTGLDDNDEDAFRIKKPKSSLPPKVNLSMDISKASSLLKEDLEARSGSSKGITYWADNKLQSKDMGRDIVDYSRMNENITIKRKPSMSNDDQAARKQAHRLSMESERRRQEALMYPMTAKPNFPVTVSPALPIARGTLPQEGIPLNLFMDCLTAKKPVEKLNIQPNVKMPLQYFLEVAKATSSSGKTGLLDPFRSSLTSNATSGNPMDMINKLPGSCTVTSSSVPVTAKNIANQVTSFHSKSKALTSADALKKFEHTRAMVNFQPSRITSPYKTQTTVLSKPEVSNTSQRYSRDMTPPPAHFRSRATPELSSGDEPEIIDLTSPNRSIEGASHGGSFSSFNSSKEESPTAESYFVPRTTTSQYPMPPKKNRQARTPVTTNTSDDPEIVLMD